MDTVNIASEGLELDITINQKYKSIPSGTSFKLPKFSVITGKNGSGKSHLLEALASASFSSIKVGGRFLRHIQFVKFGELSAVTDTAFDPASLIQEDRKFWSKIESLQAQFKAELSQNPSLTEKRFIEAQARRTNSNNSEVIERIQNASAGGTSLLQLDQAKVIELSPGLALSNEKEIFSASLAKIFNTYNVRFLENEFQNFLYQNGKASKAGLSDGEFQEKFGPKPWVLVNDILKRAGLTYQVVPPTEENRNHTYTLQLIDKQSGMKISVVDLSTGEKVLMALGLAIYRTKENGQKPDVLLLDEPDAPLHPEFSHLLIEVLLEVIVGQAGVRVIMSTHSPSTLAMSPEESVFEMNRDMRCPTQISREKGVRLLTAGIPHLRVSTEPRRQIFVESKYDVGYFERLFNALHRHTRFEYEPIFLQPHSGTSSCSDVKEIVEKLKNSGSDLVRGIIDWDSTNVTKDPVYVLGDGKRYSIENYILDPLFIALALIKAEKKSFSDFGVAGKERYLEVSSLTERDAQDLADNVLLQAGISNTGTQECRLLNGWNATRPQEFLEMRGHDWEDLVISKLPELNELIKGRSEEDRLKRPVLGIVEDVPEYLPIEIRETLEKVG